MLAVMLNPPRQSTFIIGQDQEKTLATAQEFISRLAAADIQLLKHVTEFKTSKLDPDDALDSEETEARDPAIVAADVAAQISYLRKLKFQYLEQNAKDRYVKSIVSDIDDAPIVTADDNDELLSTNAAKKEKLKIAKAKLAEIHQDIRTLSPLVAQDYRRVEASTAEAAALMQKIIDSRLALARLRKTHPHPRLTIPLADQKLQDQVTEMQTLSDEVEATNAQIQALKDRVKQGSLELERIRTERAEMEKAVKQARVDEDDGRLVPLYNWYTNSMRLHRTLQDLHESHSVSGNELRLTYAIDAEGTSQHLVTITLIFTPDTRQLASVQTQGLEELGVDVGDVIDAHVQVHDVHGVIAAILARARMRHLSSLPPPEKE